VRYRGEDEVDVELAGAGRTHLIRGHRQSELLAELADRLFRDRRRGESAAEEGWITKQRLCGALDVTYSHLNSIVCRLRHLLRRLDFIDESVTIEMRAAGSKSTASATELRLRVANVHVE
jgi:hypothetical protein